MFLGSAEAELRAGGVREESGERRGCFGVPDMALWDGGTTTTPARSFPCERLPSDVPTGSGGLMRGNVGGWVPL